MTEPCLRREEKYFTVQERGFRFGGKGGSMAGSGRTKPLGRYPFPEVIDGISTLVQTWSTGLTAAAEDVVNHT